LLDDVGPGVADVGEVAVVGRVVDEETYVVVACLVGIGVVKLSLFVSILPIKTRKEERHVGLYLHRQEAG
jgi:hypothetical protein